MFLGKYSENCHERLSFAQFYYMNKKTKYFKQMYKKFELKNRKSYSLKNKYRNREDSNQV